MVKPRIGGGFGAKQTVVAEVYPAIVTWLTGRPAMIIYTREEYQHLPALPGMRWRCACKVGANRDGHIRAIDRVHPVQHRRLRRARPHHRGPLRPQGYPPVHGNLEAYPLRATDVVYTNLQPAGAYRGYGATQGIFAVEIGGERAG